MLGDVLILVAGLALAGVIGDAVLYERRRRRAIRDGVTRALPRDTAIGLMWLRRSLSETWARSIQVSNGHAVTPPRADIMPYPRESTPEP
jgi:hypothetical protein